MNDDEEDFAAMFEASIKAAPLRSGQTVEGTIVALGQDVAFVDVGAKGEASIALDELRDADGALEAAVGDRIQATVVSTGGGVTLSRRLQRHAASAQHVEDAFRSGLPVEGKVERAGKAGYDVSVGRLRAFCPMSQIDIARVADPAVHAGRVYTFRVLEFADAGRTFVVSRRALLEAEQQARAEEVRRTLVPDAVVTGRVVSIRDFGAFVDFGGGVQGLLHISEMGWSRVDDPASVVTVGENITVRVLRVDEAKRQIALGLRQLMADPWSAVTEKYAAGQTCHGRISRIADFGVFVDVAPGITGLIPASETGIGAGQDLRKALAIGADVDVVVLEVDPSARRMRLSLKAVTTAAEAAEVRDYQARQDPASEADIGSLADKLRGALGKRKG